jgi:Domain of unknown function (DUF4112)
MDLFMALMVFKTCNQIKGGLPQAAKAQMMFNIMLDFGIGLIPFLGDLADAIYKCNSRNAIVLENHLRKVGKKNLRQSGLPEPLVDPSLGEEYDKDDDELPPSYESAQPAPQQPMRPQGAATNSPPGGVSRGNTRHASTSQTTRPAATSGGGGRGFLSSFRGGDAAQHPDLEMGETGANQVPTRGNSKLSKKNLAQHTQSQRGSRREPARN